MSHINSLRQSNSVALGLSQEAAVYLGKNKNTATSTFPIPFASYPESIEVWLMYERLLFSSLRTGDDKAAHACLERLVERFGPTHERVMGLRGLYQEAVANNDTALERILKEYDDVLAEDPVNAPIAKRRIALLYTLSRTTDAIAALVELLEYSPTDIEGWTELSELYLSQNLFSQAVFCLEEVLLVAPNAWNIHARLGEVLYLWGTCTSAEMESKTLIEATRRFCRSVELCNDYVRGYYGLKVASDHLLACYSDNEAKRNARVSGSDESSLPSKTTVLKLNKDSTSKLADLMRQATDKAHPEIVAIKSLLERTTQPKKH